MFETGRQGEVESMANSDQVSRINDKAAQNPQNSESEALSNQFAGLLGSALTTLEPARQQSKPEELGFPKFQISDNSNHAETVQKETASGHSLDQKPGDYNTNKPQPASRPLDTTPQSESKMSGFEQLAKTAWSDIEKIAAYISPIQPAMADTVLVRNPDGSLGGVGNRSGNVITWTDQNGVFHTGIQN